MSRIVGEPVPPCFPEAGHVRVLCIGEAPGPRGADKSGVPFFGDRAGAPLYRALVARSLGQGQIRAQLRACTPQPEAGALVGLPLGADAR